MVLRTILLHYDTNSHQVGYKFTLLTHTYESALVILLHIWNYLCLVFLLQNDRLLKKALVIQERVVLIISHYKKYARLWLFGNDHGKNGHRFMTNFNNLVVNSFEGLKPKNITTKFLRKVIASLHDLVIIQTALAYNLFSSRLRPI